MSKKVQEFIDKMKKEERKKRDEHLISLGLIDESKTIITRIDENVYSHTPDSRYDKEKGCYYVETTKYFPIEITDEEYQEILKYSSFANNKTEEIKEVVEEVSTTWANVIKVIANILLVLNIIGGFFLYIMLADSYKTENYAWIPIVSALSYCILYYPLIVGFSKIVAIAERKLQE